MAQQTIIIPASTVDTIVTVVTNISTQPVSPTTTTTSTSTTTKSPSSTTTTTTSTSTTTQAPPSGGIVIYGFGAAAVGGQNSSVVYHVTNLNSSGAGSLKNGIASNRTIVFDVAGTINARHDIGNTSYLTIDGTTAPYPGITISTKEADGMSIGEGSHHIIVKGLTFYRCVNDGLNVVDNAHDVAITNCTAYGNGDGNIDLAAVDGQNITMQYCIIGSHDQSVNPSNKGTGGTLVTSRNVSLHHNLFNVKSPVEGERCPFVHCNYSPVGAPNADIRNNLVWNWGRSNATGSGYGTGVGYNATANIVNNYYKTISSLAVNDGITLNVDGTSSRGYITGNVSGNGINYNSKSNSSEYTIPAQSRIPAQSACESASEILSKAGMTQRSGGQRVPAEQAFINGITLTNC
jgi:hypothetical protein